MQRKVDALTRRASKVSTEIVALRGEVAELARTGKTRPDADKAGAVSDQIDSIRDILTSTVFCILQLQADINQESLLSEIRSGCSDALRQIRELDPERAPR